MNQTFDQSESLRQETISILKKLAEKSAQYKLPKPPEALDDYRSKLMENTYKVLVVGEAKRGKSTFINALIGRSILPTDVDIATSQVFYISQAEREAYRLRFEDDSQQEITLEYLPRYGSQVVADAVGIPRLDQIIRWIEVDIPVRFLPKGVSLLDTPGLGALYAAHAQITHRFVPRADAVIFVLDSEKPVVQAELEFIETILGVTRHIFFIQTKIDLVGRAWHDVHHRNQEVLRDRFKGKLADTRVWPISSTHLIKVAEVSDEEIAEAYLMKSRHKELAVALQDFLFRVAGWGRAAEAVLLAEHYQTVSHQTLSARLAALTADSEQKVNEIRESVAKRKRRFETEWEENGQKREELMKEIKKVISVGKQSFTQSLE